MKYKNIDLDFITSHMSKVAIVSDPDAVERRRMESPSFTPIGSGSFQAQDMRPSQLIKPQAQVMNRPVVLKPISKVSSIFKPVEFFVTNSSDAVNEPAVKKVRKDSFVADHTIEANTDEKTFCAQPLFVHS